MTTPTDSEAKERPIQSPIHCWHDGGNSTCLLQKYHEGPHIYTPDDEIRLKFSDPGNVRSEP